MYPRLLNSWNSTSDNNGTKIPLKRFQQLIYSVPRYLQTAVEERMLYSGKHCPVSIFGNVLLSPNKFFFIWTWLFHLFRIKPCFSKFKLFKDLSKKELCPGHGIPLLPLSTSSDSPITFRKDPAHDKVSQSLNKLETKTIIVRYTAGEAISCCQVGTLGNTRVSASRS